MSDNYAIVARLARVETEVGLAYDEIRQIVDDLYSDVNTKLFVAESEVGGAVDEMIGSTFNILDKSTRDLTNQIDKMFTETLRQITEREGEIASTGVRFPYTIEERLNDLADDSGDAILNRTNASTTDPLFDYSECITPTGPIDNPCLGADGRVFDPVTGLCCNVTIPGIFDPAPVPPVPPVIGLPFDPTCVDRIDCHGVPPGLPPPPIPPRPPAPRPPRPVPGPAPAPPGRPPLVEPPFDPPYPPPPPTPVPEPDPPRPPAPRPPGPPPPGADPAACPVPVMPPAPCPAPGAPTPVPAFYWGNTEVCKTVEERIVHTEGVGAGGDPAPPGVTIADAPMWWQAISYPVRSTYVAWEWISNGFSSEAAEEGKRWIGSTMASLGTAMYALNEALGGVDLTMLKHPRSAAYFGGHIAAARLAEEKTRLPVEYLAQSKVYQFQYANPQYLPDQSANDASLLMGLIDEGTWECRTKALGNIPETAWQYLRAKKVKPGVGEVLSLWMRGKIDKPESDKRLRNLGVLDFNDRESFRTLTEFIPPYSDLIRMMVRDSADDTVAAKYDYDRGFTNKFTGPMEEWAKAQGIPADVFKYLWRAHWSIPSNTALYEMYHRLRPDRPEVKKWEAEAAQFAGVPGWAAANPAPTSIKLEDVRQALEINDVAPAWVQPLLDISYRPITNTDAARAFEIGVYNEDELKNAFLDNGYNKANAETLVKFYKQLKARRIGNVTGVWSIRKTVNYYKKGGIDRNQATQRLIPLVPDMETINRVLDGAETEMQAEAIQANIAAVRKAYLYGEIDKDLTETRLDQLGVGIVQIAQLIFRWDGDKRGKLKEPTVRMLAGWYMRGIISPTNLYERLRRLGYTDADANRILNASSYDLAEKNEKSAKALQKEIEAAIRTKKAAQAANDKQLKDALDNAQKQIVRIQEEYNRRAANAGLPEPYPGL